MTSNQFLPLVDLNGIWHQAYFAGLAIAASLFVFSIGRGLPLSGKVLWSYFLIRCLFILEYPLPHFGWYTHSFQSTAGQASVELLLIPFIALRFGVFADSLAPFMALFACLCVWLHWPGFMHAPSFNMALAAASIPLISPWMASLVILTALAHHGTTALLIILAQLCVGVARGVYKKWILLLGVPLAAFSAYHFQNQPLLNSGERIEKWLSYLTFWVGDWHRIVWGYGPGSFIWHSILNHPYKTGVYLQMHCDFLEVLWAGGVIGGALTLWFLFDAVKKAWKMPLYISQGVIGSLVFMLTYSPLTYFPSAFLTAYFFSLVFSDQL